MGAEDGDAEFSAFMAENSPALLRTAWLLCGDPHRAEELTQQALVNTYASWRQARQGDPLAYARRVLVNSRISAWRKHRRELLTAPFDVPEVADSGDQWLVLEREALVRALRALPPKQRRIVVLRHYMGLSEHEVAEELGVSIGTVKAAASRGLRRMRTDPSLPDGVALRSSP